MLRAQRVSQRRVVDSRCAFDSVFAGVSNDDGVSEKRFEISTERRRWAKQEHEW
jgi:hypothetical protein